MNATQLARQAYAPSTFSLKPGRDVEAQIIGQVTSRLKSAAAHADADFPRFVQALHENRQMWLLLATDVAHEDNALTKQVRAQIFYLAEFTDQHTAKVLRSQASADPLIEINATILRGLNPGQVR